MARSNIGTHSELPDLFPGICCICGANKELMADFPCPGEDIPPKDLRARKRAKRTAEATYSGSTLDDIASAIFGDMLKGMRL